MIISPKEIETLQVETRLTGVLDVLRRRWAHPVPMFTPTSCNAVEQAADDIRSSVVPTRAGPFLIQLLNLHPNCPLNPNHTFYRDLGTSKPTV